MIINIVHPDLGPQKTYLTAQVSESDTSSTVENNDGFASGELVLFGKYGQEKTEDIVLTGVTGNTQLDHATGPLFDHPARTPVYEVLFDQAEIYRATAEGGTYSLITTIDLDFDEDETIYNDTGGTTSSWYKIRYKNSQDSSFSDYSDEVQGTGFTDNSLGSMTEEILEIFGDQNAEEITRDQVKNYLNAGVRKMVMSIIKSYPDYFGAYSTQALSASTTYSYPSNFISFMRINVGTSVTSSYSAEFVQETLLDPTANYLETDPKVVMRNTTWKTYPDCAGKTAYIWFWQYPSAMSNETDEHGLPYGGRDVLVTYALYRIWLEKDADRARSMKTLLNEQTDEYLQFVGQRRQGHSSKYQRVTFGAEDYFYDRWGF